MFKVCLVLCLFATVYSESVRETETWMPMNMTRQPDDLVSSGDSPNGSDFGFTDDKYAGVDAETGEDDTLYDDEDEEEEEEFSGSGDGATVTRDQDHIPDLPDVNDNKIPELERPVKPAVDETERVTGNDIDPPRMPPPARPEQPSNVLMSHAGDESIFNKTEVLAALIAGGAVGLMFAVLLILLLIYRMKKKDEGSYDLGKKPIYKKAPTTEIYA